MTENTNKNEIIVNYIAGIFALLGILAIIYKLYLYGITKNNVIDALITMSQIITIASVVILGMSEIIKNRKGAAKRKFTKALRHWDKKYNTLVKFEIDEKVKGTTNGGKDCVFAQMLMNHSNILESEEYLNSKPNSYTKFAIIPVDLQGSEIMFFIKDSMFKKVEGKDLKKNLNKIKTLLDDKYKDIIREPVVISDNRSDFTIIRLHLKKDLEENSGNYNKILELLDFMTMVYLAIA